MRESSIGGTRRQRKLSLMTTEPSGRLRNRKLSAGILDEVSRLLG